MERGSLREYFECSKLERTGVLTLLAVIAICRCIPRIWEVYMPPAIPTDSSFLAEVTAFEQQLAAADTARRKTAYTHNRYRQREMYQPYYRQYAREGRNTKYQPEGQYPRYRQENNATGYQSKGTFPDSDRHSQYPQEQHYGRYQQSGPGTRRPFSPDSPAPRRSYPPRPARRLPVLNINAADSLDLEILPGIGPALAGRIIRFRERLGGFHSPAQVAEIYGLPDSTFKKIQPYLRVDNGSLKKLDINHTDEQSLAQHPYIRYKLARLIVRYRSVHGPFSDIKGIKNIPLVDDSIYRKLEPYISSN